MKKHKKYNYVWEDEKIQCEWEECDEDATMRFTVVGKEWTYFCDEHRLLLP